MVCRNADRAAKARQDIVDLHATAADNLEILVGDVGLRADVVRVRFVHACFVDLYQMQVFTIYYDV